VKPEDVDRRVPSSVVQFPMTANVSFSRSGTGADEVSAAGSFVRAGVFAVASLAGLAGRVAYPECAVQPVWSA
jgi:hypothetical protein